MRGLDTAAGADSFADGSPVAASLSCVCGCCNVVNRLPAFASGGANADEKTVGKNPRYVGVGICLWRVSRHSPGCGSGDRGDNHPCRC